MALRSFPCGWAPSQLARSGQKSEVAQLIPIFVTLKTVFDRRLGSKRRRRVLLAKTVFLSSRTREESV